MKERGIPSSDWGGSSAQELPCANCNASSAMNSRIKLGSEVMGRDEAFSRNQDQLLRAVFPVFALGGALPAKNTAFARSFSEAFELWPSSFRVVGVEAPLLVDQPPIVSFKGEARRRRGTTDNWRTGRPLGRRCKTRGIDKA